MRKISIITVNLNNSDGLLKTIKSVVEQKCSDYEYIVIDGGSTDQSVQVIKQYKDKIQYWVSEPDKGIYNAMNKGIKIAKGEYCYFLNSGDTFNDANILSFVNSNLGENDIVYGNLKFIDNLSERISIQPEKLELDRFYQGTLYHPATFIKKELFNQYGKYNEDYKIAGDYEFFLRIFLKGKIVTKYIDYTIAAFDINGISSSPENLTIVNNERKKAKEQFAVKIIWDKLEKLNQKSLNYETLLDSRLIRITLNLMKFKSKTLNILKQITLQK